MFIAAKFEEIYPPKTKHFIAICDNAFNKEDLLQAEFLILSKLNYKVLISTEAEVLDLIGFMFGINKKLIRKCQKFVFFGKMYREL